MGTPKALLASPHGDGNLAEHAVALLRACCDDVVLVGARAPLGDLGVPTLADARADSGPLGGLVSLLRVAGDRTVIAVACDMPYVTPALLACLVAAPPCVALAPRDAGRWEPLFSRWTAAALPRAEAHLAAAQLSLQALLDALGAHELPLDADARRALRDWDTPADVLGR